MPLPQSEKFSKSAAGLGYTTQSHKFGSKALLDSTFAFSSSQQSVGNSVCGYVTDLQIHMALQARHLLPSMNETDMADHHLKTVHQAQADMERTASRQWF